MNEPIESTTLAQSYSGPHESIYDGQVVTVIGTVTYVGPDPYGLPGIEFGDAKNRVLFVVDDFGGLEVGDSASITGHCEGFTRGMVVMKHCQIN